MVKEEVGTSTGNWKRALKAREVVKEELHCPKCGSIVRAEDKCCWNCRAKLIFIYTCPNCGAEVSSEDKYCRHCGHKLRW